MSSGDIEVLRDRMVTARDGVNLATDVYLPAGHRIGDVTLAYSTTNPACV